MLINTGSIFQFHVRLRHWGNCSVESKFVYKDKREFIRRSVTRKSQNCRERDNIESFFWRHKAQIDNDIHLHHRVAEMDLVFSLSSLFCNP